MLTVDNAVFGRRERDHRRGFTLPPQIGPRTLLDGALHPEWTWRFVRAEPIRFANVTGRDVGDGTDAVSLHEYIDTPVRPDHVVARPRVAPRPCGAARSSSRASRPSTTRCSPPKVGVAGGHALEPRRPPARRRRPRRSRSSRPVTDAVGDRGRGDLRRRRPARLRHREGGGARREGRRRWAAPTSTRLGAAGERGVDHLRRPPHRRHRAHDGPPRRASTIPDLTREYVDSPF